jgi:CheY-like chemotaxis protein
MQDWLARDDGTSGPAAEIGDCFGVGSHRIRGGSAKIEARHEAAAPPAWHHRSVRPTVLIVDDHADFRRSARALLEAEGFHVVGEVADGLEAIRAMDLLRPDVVLLDIQLPGPDGLTVAEQIGARSDPPMVVLISSRDATSFGPRLRQSPARGFIPKGALSGEALAALLD